MLGAALSVAFFFSGAAGLIFQVVWFHRAGLVFGSSVWAVTIVLSSFMGGLALGNALAGKYASRVGRPLFTYARLEALVAIAGLAVTFLLPHFTVVLRPLTRLASDSVSAVNAIRLVAAFFVLIVPATAMGATFPVVVGAVSAGADRFGVALGRLYGWNTLGAVVGVMAAELILIDRFGVAGTALTAAVLNLVAAGLAMLPSVSVGDGFSASLRDALEGRPLHSKNASVASALPLRALLTAAFLSGMALLALEVTWFRFLTMYVLSTTLAASLMLAVVLAGIAIGGLIGSVWSNRAPERAAAVVSLLAACVVIVTYGSFQSLTSGTQVGDWQKILWFACVLTAPTSLLSGLFFTLVGRAIRRAVDQDTRAAAWLTVGEHDGRALRSAACRIRAPAARRHGTDIFHSGRSVRRHRTAHRRFPWLCEKPSSLADRDWHGSRCARVTAISLRGNEGPLLSALSRSLCG